MRLIPNTLLKKFTGNEHNNRIETTKKLAAISPAKCLKTPTKNLSRLIFFLPSISNNGDEK